MQEWLVICLRAPLASFGENPGNAERGTADMPTRSALIGLAAAALGVEREDAEGQARLAADLTTASALYDRGEPMGDFHTYQSLRQAAKGAATRADALQKHDYIETSITRRHYRTDGLWQAAYRLSGTGSGQTTLAALAGAFETPHFVLYLGRKSCPLSHPLVPRIIAHETVTGAFNSHFRLISKTANRRNRLDMQLVCVERESDAPADIAKRMHTRRDDPRDRSTRWTFSDRPEWRFRPVERVQEKQP